MKPFPIIKQASLFAVSLFAGITAHAERPQILTTADQHEAIAEKMASVPWAQSAFSHLTEKVDYYVAKTEAEPDWMTSRLAMNWDTHYTQAISEKSRTIGGQGKAPVPTPRFAGARDWKTDYIRQPIDEMMPYNDKDGQIFLINEKTGEQEWVDVSITGHAIERINRELIELSADAAFLYWVTGDDKYAEFAAPLLWTYMHGLSFVEAPLIKDADGGPKNIIGTTSYEVIHDGIIEPLAVSYDFLHDYIQEQENMDGKSIELAFKKIIDRIIEGGGRGGNWNLHQAQGIIYGGLALDDNIAYEDGKGREYYIDIALNADLPNQSGLVHVIREGYDQETAVWPEAPGYAFGTTANIVQIATLVANDPNGEAVLKDPIVLKALLSQLKQTYPSGHSHGLGDTSYTRIDTRALELMLGWAVRSGESTTAQALSAALKGEIDAGKYSREKQSSLLALISYVAELPEADASALQFTPTYFAKPINLAMLRSMPENGDIRYALGAAIFGTQGGHMHANGLAVELYGAGQVLGIDSGRGSSYWQADHGEYYSKAPAHNTVIVNGVSDYPRRRQGTIAMTVEAVEPAFNQPASNPHLTYLTAAFKYKEPAASQQRTLALVRIDETTAFYFDVFRSKRDETDAEQYHDWFYHSMADSLELPKVKLKSSELLTTEMGNQKGYDYFTEETSAETNKDLHARFPLTVESNKVAMDLWILGGKGRRVFTVEAPANRAARHNMDESYWNRPMPTMVVRQLGEAWDRPFVAVYEPSLQSDEVQVKSVKAIGDNSWRVSGDDWVAILTLDGVHLSLDIEE